MTTLHHRRRVRALLIGTAIAGFGASHALAAAPSGGQSSTLQEIVVTARKTNESLQSTPLAMTALNSTLLQKAQINSLDDLGSVVPSMLTKAEPSFGGTTTIALRGFSDTNPTNLLGDGPVALYFDGVYIGRDAGDTFSLVDLSRVEVEAGPQGTLFGRNVTGGAISLYSKPPAKSFHVEEKLGYGSYNDRLTRTTVDTGELGNTGFYAKLAYMHHDNEGYGVTNTDVSKKSDNPGAMSDNGYFFSLHGNLTANITADYVFNWNANTNVGYASQPIAMTALDAAYYGASASHGGQAFPVLGTPGPGGLVEVQPNFESTVAQRYTGPNVIDTGGHGLTLNWEANDDISIKSITGYRSLALTSAANFGGSGDLVGNVNSGLAPPFGAGPNPIYEPINILNTLASQFHQYQWSEELQLNGKFDRFTYVSGLYYFDEHVGERNQNSSATAVVDCLASVGGACVFPSPLTFGAQIGDSVDAIYDGTAASRAAYFDGTYKPQGFNDKLEFSGGVRYTWDTKSIDQTYSSGVLNPPVEKRVNFFNLAGSGSVKYQWTPVVMTYLRVGNSYRAGGYNPESTVAGAANSYNPEGVLSWETGIKSDWFEHRLRIDADTYYTDYTGEQVALTGTACGVGTGGTAAFSSCTGNAGRVRLIGFEGQFSVLPVEGWELDGSIGLIASKYLEYRETGLSDTQGGNLRDLDLKVSNLPAETATLALQYSFPSQPYGNLSLRMDWAYRSRTYTDIDPSTGPNGNGPGTTPGFTPTLYDASAPPFNNLGAQVVLARIPVHGATTLDAEFFAKNLLDEHDVLISTDLTSSLGFANEAWGPGRTFGVLLTGKF